MFETDLHVQVFENRIRVRNVHTGGSSEVRPTVPFSHPRALVGNFTEAESALKAAVVEVGGTGFLKSVRMLVQPMENCEGGLTQVESRVLRELALGAGAHRVVVWEGGPLDHEAVKAELRKA